MDKGSYSLSTSAPMNGGAVDGLCVEGFSVRRTGLRLPLREACGTARDGRRWALWQGGTRVSVRRWDVCQWHAGQRSVIGACGRLARGSVSAIEPIASLAHAPMSRRYEGSELPPGSMVVVKGCAIRRPDPMAVVAMRGRLALGSTPVVFACAGASQRPRRGISARDTPTPARRLSLGRGSPGFSLRRWTGERSRPSRSLKAELQHPCGRHSSPHTVAEDCSDPSRLPPH